MVDAYCPYGGDIQIDQNGDIQTAVGWDEVEQSIQRELFTNPAAIDENGLFLGPDYPWNPNYGLGLPRVLGSIDLESTQTILENKCRQAVLSNPAVLQNPPPVVQFLLDQHALSIYIFVYLANQEPGIIALEYTG